MGNNKMQNEPKPPKTNQIIAKLPKTSKIIMAKRLKTSQIFGNH